MKSRLLILLASVAMIGAIALTLTGCKKKSSTGPAGPVKVNAWAVGNQDSTTYGTILYTADGGETWVRQGLGSAALKGIDVENLYVVNASEVYAVCTQNIIIKTTDGGQTWTRLTTPVNPANPNLSSISSADNNTFWISGEHGVVYKYNINSGFSTPLFDTNFFHSGLMQGIHAITQDIIYVVGSYGNYPDIRGFIAFTRDAGTSWDTIAPPDADNTWAWIGVKATSTENIIIHGTRAHYIYSQDNGSTWHKDSITVAGDADINCIVMVTNSIYWGAGDYAIYKTSNGGISWRTQTNFGQYQLGIDALDTLSALCVWGDPMSSIGKIQKTSDGGNTWTVKLALNSRLQKVSYAH